MMSSHTHGRLGDQRTAVRIANEAVTMAEQLDDRASLADALNRLGTALVAEAPSQARVAYARALNLYEAIGDVRGQARGYSNMGMADMFEAKLDESKLAFSKGIAVAKAAGIPDVWGLAALNLGVLTQKCGDYDRARELFGEALALFAAVKHSEYQLAALYNMAHVERELGLWESAAALYDATTPLAQRIGQSDIEIGATAGTGLCFLELGRLDAARAASREAQLRMESRPDWFQGREIAEALRVRVEILDGKFSDAIRHFDRAEELAEAADLYSAAWLTATCADALAPHAPERVKVSIARYRSRLQELGYPEMTRRYDALSHG
jgi:tetratricopeptide (TPR) repeat protein